MKLSLKDIPTRDILLRQQEWWENKDLPFTYEAFPQWPEKLVFKKMERLADEGYLEYGVSLRTAWLSEKGKQFLKVTKETK